MVTSTRTRRRAPAQYVAIGLPPDMVDKLMEQLDEEGAIPVRVEHDDEGAALVFFQLASWDTGAWLTSLAQRFGCGLAPCRAQA
jgi:hypothetical protein